MLASGLQRSFIHAPCLVANDFCLLALRVPRIDVLPERVVLGRLVLRGFARLRRQQDGAAVAVVLENPVLAKA